MLQAHSIESVADVRRYPASRRHPQFNQTALAEVLGKSRIDYVHFPELGGRRSARKDSPNTVWRVEAFRGYADYMMTPEFQKGIERLLVLGVQKRTTLLCAEALWWRCHRALIADYLKAGGHRSITLRGPTRRSRIRLPLRRRIVDGKLSYQAQNQSLELGLS